MVTIDLITGFLGSGKTTFLKKYAEYLMDQGLHIGILENDFGAINVDMLMLHELRGDQCELEMIAGGCDAESHRRRFRTKLISMRMCGYDRVLVEPSGIYDVDEFFDALREEPLDQWYEIGNVIAILDARLENNLSQQADYLLASEAANAGKVILSHADAAAREQCEDTVAHLNRALEQIRCDRRIDPEKDILQKNLTDLTKEDLEEVSQCGYRLESYRKMDLENGQSFDSLFFMEEKIKPEALERAVPRLFSDKSCGEVFRIKGFVKNGAGQWMELNATPDSHTMQSVAVGQEVLIAELDKPGIVTALPDRDGMVEVRAGIIKTKVPLNGLCAPHKQQPAPQKKYQPRRAPASASSGDKVTRTPSMEINLIGMTVEEALHEADKFIDNGVMNGQTTLYLIHGKGTGALRKGIHEHLRRHKNVRSFRLGVYGEGEAGVTVVELK